MIEIMESGPVQGEDRFRFVFAMLPYVIDRFVFSIFFSATLHVYRDLFSYRSGIYKHSGANRGEASGFHSVRLIGWGEERSGYTTTKYWVHSSRSLSPFV